MWDQDTHIGIEASLENAEESASHKLRLASVEPELRPSNEAPEDHLHGNPAVRSHPLGNQLRWKFSTEVGKLDDAISQVVICGPRLCVFCVVLCVFFVVFG